MLHMNNNCEFLSRVIVVFVFISFGFFSLSFLEINFVLIYRLIHVWIFFFFCVLNIENMEHLKKN